MNIAEFVLYLRTQAEESQRVFARKHGISTTMCYRIEHQETKTIPIPFVLYLLREYKKLPILDIE